MNALIPAVSQRGTIRGGVGGGGGGGGGGQVFNKKHTFNLRICQSKQENAYVKILDVT